MVEEDVPYCSDGCGRFATAERIAGVFEDGTLIVELVCQEHVG